MSAPQSFLWRIHRPNAWFRALKVENILSPVMQHKHLIILLQLGQLCQYKYSGGQWAGFLSVLVLPAYVTKRHEGAEV
jgi:hypothetical protein